jgi:hypothetical protein
MKQFYLFIKSACIYLLLLLLPATEIEAQGPGTALEYDGIDDFTTMPAGIIPQLTGDVTIEFWVYWRGTNAMGDPNNPILQPLFQRVFDFGNNDMEWMMFTPTTNFGTFGATFALTTTGGNTPFVIQSQEKLPLNAWSHVAITIDVTSTTAKLYINGELEGTNTNFNISPSVLGNTTNNYLGRSQYATDPYFSGIIDEFRISNIVRYTGNFTPYPVQFQADANTIVLFHFNEGSGQTSIDAGADARIAILGGSIAIENSDPTWILNSILPVKIHYLTVKKNGNSVQLEWKAESVNEEGYFIIERSENGTNFKAVGKIKIKDGSHQYSFTDPLTAPGKFFYRLHVNEMNGQSKYSSIVWVDLNDHNSYGLYPTLATSEIFIKVPRATRLEIYDRTGKLMKRVQVQASQNINVQDLPVGNYFIRFEGNKQVERFIRL